MHEGQIATGSGALLIRRRVTSFMIIAVAGFCGIAGLVGILDAVFATGTLVLATVPSIPMSMACLGIALGGIAAFELHRRQGGLWHTRLLCLTLVFVISLSLPHSVFESSLPQVIWVPALVAAVLCEAWFVGVTAVLTGVVLYIVHGHMPAFTYFLPVFNGVALAVLIVLFSWLQDVLVKHQLQESERATYLAFHDPLTGLPNRRLVQDRLEMAIERAKRSETLVGVLFIDLDHFARVNDTLGHDVGDAVIRKTASRLQEALRTTDTIGRFGGDEFVVILGDVRHSDAVQRIARNILETVRQPVDAMGHVVHITVSLGVAFYPTDGLDSQTVVRFADQALYEAKDAGRNQVHFSTPALQKKAHRWFQLAQDLREAHIRQELSLVYQPIRCFRTGRIRKAEALVRWTHPVEGPIGPSEFIPIAESTGSIHAIGDWVLKQAAMQAVTWRSEGAENFRISVNRSPVQFREDRGDAHPCLALLESLGVPPDVVTLELTENVLLHPDAQTLQQLDNLRSAGIRLSLDDFGTGYSSLSHLHSFDMDLVKIDRRFVASLRPGTKNFILCQGIILIAHALGLEVVAEGIETQEQHDLLLEMGCDYGQGYFIGHPTPANEFSRRLYKEPSLEAVAT